MDIHAMIEEIKGHPESARMGMIASHLGIVRGTSLDGRPVTGIRVRFKDDVIRTIADDIRSMPGIVEVMIQTNGGDLKVGDEVMAVVVGGDTRDHVFPALIEAVARIKKDGSDKHEDF